jgi:hypothetical protein
MRGVELMLVDEPFAGLDPGVPVAASYGSEAGLFTVTAVIIGDFGAPALAAYAVVNQLVYVVFQVSVGISHGSSILVSRVLGLGDPGRARSIATVALTYGALTAPTWVLSLFMDTKDVAATAIATTLLAVAAVQQFADSAQKHRHRPATRSRRHDIELRHHPDRLLGGRTTRRATARLPTRPRGHRNVARPHHRTRGDRGTPAVHLPPPAQPVT